MSICLRTCINRCFGLRNPGWKLPSCGLANNKRKNQSFLCQRDNPCGISWIAMGLLQQLRRQRAPDNMAAVGPPSTPGPSDIAFDKQEGVGASRVVREWGTAGGSSLPHFAMETPVACLKQSQSIWICNSEHSPSHPKIRLMRLHRDGSEIWPQPTTAQAS